MAVSPLARLQPLPPTLRLLTNEQAGWLADRYPSVPRTPRGCATTCKGRGQFRWYGPDREVLDYQCPCNDQYLLHRCLLYAGVGLALQRISWDDGTGICPTAIAAAHDYLGNASAYVSAGLGLTLTGTARGVGKTMVAALVLKELVGKGHDGYLTTFNEMLEAFSGGWRDAALKEWFSTRVRNAGVLLVDDLGRERQTARSIADPTLEDVLRHRTQHALPTILTTNLTGSEIASGYNGHVVSVLAEASIVVEFSGSDYRSRYREQLEADTRAGLTRPVVLG